MVFNVLWFMGGMDVPLQPTMTIKCQNKNTPVKWFLYKPLPTNNVVYFIEYLTLNSWI